MSIEAMKQALEALQATMATHNSWEAICDAKDEAITALRQAIEQAESVTKEAKKTHCFIQQLNQAIEQAEQYNATSDHCLMENAKGELERIKLVQTGVGIGKPEQEPVAWADDCRIELVTAIHMLSSDFENALYAFRGDTEARKSAEGSIAHARGVAVKWNRNGRTSPPSNSLNSIKSDKTLDAQRQPLEGVIDVQPIGYHSLQLIFRSQADIAKFKTAHGIKEKNT